jgi:hypothetical protein
METDVTLAWHRGLLRRISAGFLVYLAAGILAGYVAILPVFLQEDELRLRKLAEIHKKLLGDFHELARTAYDFHDGSRSADTQNPLEPMRVQLRLALKEIARSGKKSPLDACLATWERDLTHLQQPLYPAPRNCDRSDDATACAEVNTDVRLDELVSFRAGLSAAQNFIRFSSISCASPGQRLASLCRYFDSVRQSAIVKYEQVAEKYSPARITREEARFLRLTKRTYIDPCLDVANSLIAFRAVAEQVDGAALIQTVGDFRDLGGRLKDRRAALGLQNVAMIGGGPDGLVAFPITQAGAYRFLMLLATASIMYGHFNLRRLNWLMSLPHYAATPETVRRWPEFVPEFVAPAVGVHMRAPETRSPLARFTHQLLRLINILPVLALLTQIGSLLYLIYLILWPPPMSVPVLDPASIVLGSIAIATQAIFLVDWWRERRKIEEFPGG